MSKAGNIEDVRSHLMATLAALRSKTDPMEVNRAAAVAQVASVLIDSAKVELQYVKLTKGAGSQFLESRRVRDRRAIRTGTVERLTDGTVRHHISDDEEDPE